MTTQQKQLFGKTKPIVNITNEFGVYGGAYNPNKYKHYITNEYRVVKVKERIEL